MSLSTILPFVLTALLIELSPGPNMAYLTVVALSQGRRPALAVVVGVASGLLIIGLAAALGVVSLIERSSLLYEGLRFGGAAYLLWLAWQGWRDADKSWRDMDATAQFSLWTCFRRGLITNLLNPKAALFYIATLPQFLPASGQAAGFASEFAASAWLTLIYVAIATGVHLALVVLSARLHPLFTEPGRLKPLQKIMAVALAGLAVWLLITTAR